MGYLLGYDIGSSSIKATLIEAATGRVIATVISPKTELKIIARHPGWAEQDPQVWWDNAKEATSKIILHSKVSPVDIEAIGLSYQMHGLVIIDKDQKVLRPSIIWCDSRAVEIGEKAFSSIGKETCLKKFLNSPGNFTASKLKWVMLNEPEVYRKIHKAMLPGDYIAMMMTGESKTTPSGLSEGIMWDFQNNELANLILDNYGISPDIIPEIVPTFSIQGELTKKAADELGLRKGIKISYRAGDQPNNAFSLKVFNPGELAATAGTSGVIYGVLDKITYDPKSRVNIFAHVNHTKENPRYGILLCINGSGILYSWLKHNLMSSEATEMNYKQMDKLASQAPACSEGLVILPYGNGAERTLENRNIGCSVYSLNFNLHNRSHFLRAAHEGIVFAINYGLEIMRDLGITTTVVRVGNTNMFSSSLFGEIFATVTDTKVEIYNTDGSQGAARGAGIGAGIYKTFQDAFVGLEAERVIRPNKKLKAVYQDAYNKWVSILKNLILQKGKK
jgi:xylulokinase